MSAQISPLATVTLDGSGNGQVALGPPSGTRWQLRLATLAVTTSTLQPLAYLYRGSPSGPLELVDSTFAGAQASSGKVAGAPFFPGQLLWAKWTGGDPGAVATLQVFGQQGGRGDPFDTSPVGDGFDEPILSQLVAGNTGTRIVIGTQVPPQLAAWAALHGYSITATMVEYNADGSFTWQALMSSPTGWWTGTYDAVNGVVLFNAISSNAPTSFLEGADVNSTQILHAVVNTKLQLAQGTSNNTLLQIDLGVGYTIDGVSQGRGLVGQSASQANSAAIGAEAADLTTGNIVFRDGRAYEFAYGGQIQGSVANIATFRVRRTNAAGALVLGGIQHDAAAASNRWRTARVVATNTSGGAVSYPACLTLAASAGTVTHIGSATLTRWFEVRDVGAAADFPSAPPI